MLAAVGFAVLVSWLRSAPVPLFRFVSWISLADQCGGVWVADVLARSEHEFSA